MEIKVPGESKSDLEIVEDPRMKDFCDTHRVRLNTKGNGDWWAEVVFLVRDMRGLCIALAQRDEPAIAEVLSMIAGKSLHDIFSKVYGSEDEANKHEDMLYADAEELDAMVEKLQVAPVEH